MTQSLADKATAFRALHRRGNTFVMPNAWDAGSARLLESLRFQTLVPDRAGISVAAGIPDVHLWHAAL